MSSTDATSLSESIRLKAETVIHQNAQTAARRPVKRRETAEIVDGFEYLFFHERR